jgi:predicted double-glycine peptidase
MRSFDRIHKGWIRIFPAAALLAALFVPLVAASANDDCPPGGCPIAPPQSREVNPAPAHADGSAVEVSNASELPPVEITVHVLAPTFVEPAPVGASFEAISIPVRYQNPGDVSCGAQALGMALDALPGAAPTSGSLLGLLQDNGMMYDFGTGVEELAFAARSFGYKGSFAFHGTSFEQLQVELAAGRPVVVSLGANGEGQPGHFVTVTGISVDGQWVALNDPTQGEQVISASEFERLWELQGNSGVAVATEPPAHIADPGVLSLWVAFAAGLMALVSTTPLAKLRQGIGGMLDAGGGGNYKPVRSTPKSSPPAKEKEKEKEPKKSKSRFDDEIALPSTPPKATATRFDDDISLPSTPVSKVVVTPTELRAAQDPPPPTPAPPQARFDEEEDPEPRSSSKVSKARFDGEVGPEERAAICMPQPDLLVAGPEPTPTPTPFPQVDREDVIEGLCAVSDAVDPFQPDPAFAGGPGGLDDIIDQIVLTSKTAPPSGMPFFEAGRLVIQAFGTVRKTTSTAVSFACQQIQHEGLYYDVLPLDEKFEDVEDSWVDMSPLQKGITIGIVVGVIITVATMLLV